MTYEFMNDQYYQIYSYVLLPIGVFLLFQGYPRRKIAISLLAFLFSFAQWTEEILKGEDFSAKSIGFLKAFAVGTLVSFLIFTADCIGYSILGGSSVIPTMTLICQINEYENFETMNQANNGLIPGVMFFGLIIPAFLREHVVIPVSTVIGASCIALSISMFCADSPKEHQKYLYKERILFFIGEGVAVLLGTLVQWCFKKREDKMKEEILKQQMDETRKKQQYIAPQPVFMAYNPVIVQPMYHQPVYSAMTLSNNRPNMPIPITSPPPKEEHQSIAAIQANLAQIYVQGSENKQYDF